MLAKIMKNNIGEFDELIESAKALHVPLTSFFDETGTLKIV